MPNGPDGDPVVWVDLPDDGCSLLLDLGDLQRLPNRKLMRVDRVLVTHTHMDHFIGFDRLLRLAIRRERELTLTGPPGFLAQVGHRIQGYTWNLIGSYPVRLIVEEIDGETIRSALFTGASRMRPEPLAGRPFHGTVHGQRAYTIEACTLDHGTPVLGVVLRETEHLAVNADQLRRLGLEPGPWLSALKMAVRRRQTHGVSIEALASGGGIRDVDAEELAREILRRTPGRTLGYFTDLAHTTRNVETVVELARGVDLMICEAPFLHADAALARERHHLTARQAGELARAAGARALAPFHFSPRYHERSRELVSEAAEAFGGPVTVVPREPSGQPQVL